MSLKHPLLKITSDLNEILRHDPLREFFVDWLNCPPAYGKEFKKCLSKATTERALQKFLNAHQCPFAAQPQALPPYSRSAMIRWR
jgi:hypothetical protein